MCLYTATEFTGNLIACDEGTLEWIPIAAIDSLNLWEGDKIFFRLLQNNAPFFSLKLVYCNGTLTEKSLDGKPL